METQLGQVGDLKVAAKRQLEKTASMVYTLENGTEIEDTFAEMYRHSVSEGSVLDKLPFFARANQRL